MSAQVRLPDARIAAFMEDMAYDTPVFGGLIKNAAEVRPVLQDLARGRLPQALSVFEVLGRCFPSLRTLLNSGAVDANQPPRWLTLLAAHLDKLCDPCLGMLAHSGHERRCRVCVCFHVAMRTGVPPAECHVPDDPWVDLDPADSALFMLSCA